jgi:hypothetical protein
MTAVATMPANVPFSPLATIAIVEAQPRIARRNNSLDGTFAGPRDAIGIFDTDPNSLLSTEGTL